MNLENGTIIGRYKILARLGAGGMGEVYLAQDTRLDRRVAVKFLNEEFSRDSDKLNRFIQEAKAASALNHPNILIVHEIGEADGKNYIATEFIEGKTLREHLSADESISLSAILKIGAQVAEALSAAHLAGITHRDIKPENIMIRADGYARVLDFGLAKLTEKKKSERISLEGETKAFVQTNPGVVMGTVSYMSPEQARGKETDARTDLWSLGVVLYEMLSGKVPFAGETINHTIVSILEKEPPLLENVPDELQRIVRKALTKDKEMRYQTARDLLIDLKNLRRTLDIQGELERSIIPNKTHTTDAEGNPTQIYSENSIEETKAEEAKATRHMTNASSLEYAVTQAKSHKIATAIVGIVLLGIISSAVYFGFFARGSGRQIESIAVMPFVNESGNADMEYLSDGMTESLIRSLSELPNLSVKARSSVFRYKGKGTDAKTIGKELNVQAILNGRVIQRGDGLTLNLELIDANTENVIWTDQYDRKSSELVSLQNLIARDVSSKLKIQLSGADLEKLAKHYTNDPEAYRLYLQGRFYWNKRVGKEFERAEEYFQQAVARDPNFALGYVGLADFKEDNDRPRKKEYIRRALEIDDQLAEAHASLGYQYMVDYNWAESERELKRAIELNPNYPQAHQWNGMRLMMNGRHDEALPELTRALELDPTSPGINLYYGVWLEVTGRYNECILQTNKLIQMEPALWWAYIQLSRCYRLNGDHPAAVEAHARNAEFIGNGARAAAMRESFAKGGWRAYLQNVATSSPPTVAASYLAELGEYDKAIEAVVKQSNAPITFWLFLYRTDPFLDPVRDDPRFKEVMKKLDPPQ